MTKSIFITATGTDVGKTYTTLKIMEHFCANGVKAVPFKPIETGVLGTPLDASKLLEKYHSLYGDDSLGIEDICPYRFALPAAPYVAKGAQNIDIEVIKNAAKALGAKADIVLIEGAGGLMTPIDKDFFMIDLAQELADFTLLVSHTGLGCINDALLSKKVLDDLGIAHELVFNRRQNDSFDAVSRKFFEEYFGVMYELDDLDVVLKTAFK
jgi:dethiobiotin synthetase